MNCTTSSNCKSLQKQKKTKDGQREVYRLAENRFLGVLRVNGGVDMTGEWGWDELEGWGGLWG